MSEAACGVTVRPCARTGVRRHRAHLAEKFEDMRAKRRRVRCLLVIGVAQSGSLGRALLEGNVQWLPAWFRCRGRVHAARNVPM